MAQNIYKKNSNKKTGNSEIDRFFFSFKNVSKIKTKKMNKVHRVCVILISINHSDLSLSGKNNRSPVCDFLSAFLFFIIQLCVCVCVFLLSAVINFTFYLFHWTMSSVNAINFIALYIEIATFSIDKSCVISDKI